MSDIGFYVLTYPGDYYLSTALVRSLNYFNPGTPIMIIPGEGVNRDDHPFNVPLMPDPGGFWGQMGHGDRKFWAFQGPFEKFIYIDADIICTRSITPFIEKLKKQDGKFIDVRMTIEDEKWQQAIEDNSHEWHEQCVRRVHSQLGHLDRLKEFDPAFDPYARYPFNSGMFASSRLTIEEEAFKQVHEREKEFFRGRLNKDFSWRNFDLFFGDQGRLNYLVDRLGITRSTLYPHGQYTWGGRAKVFPLDQVLAGEADCNFIHWAGCPRPNPSLFCKSPLLRLLASVYPRLPSKYRSLNEIPGYSVWWHFAQEEQQRWKKVSEVLRWSWRDMELIVKRHARRLIGFIKRLF